MTNFIFILFALLTCCTLNVSAQSLAERAHEIAQTLEQHLSKRDLSPQDAVWAKSRFCREDLGQETILQSDSALLNCCLGENWLNLYNFEEFRDKWVPRNEKTASDPRDPRFAPYLKWLFQTENHPQIERLWNSWDKSVRSSSPALFMHAKYEFSQLKWDSARVNYEQALLAAATPRDIHNAKIGLAQVYNKDREYDRAADTLATLWTVDLLSPDAMFEMGNILIDLSRVSEAIDLFEEAIYWDPMHRMAHYYLGNGYARKNYTQLWEENDQFDCGGDDVQSLMHVESKITEGDMVGARELLEEFVLLHNCPRAQVMLGSVLWTQGEYKPAIEQLEQVLVNMPEYGRAHNGLARSLVSYQMLFNINRDSDQAIFDAKPMPDVPEIEKYIYNWASLSERHKKQIALSVEPWKKYLPVLVESGSRHYIKPLHQMLSECPNMQTIADMRISYDSRLWDDVRGCGGYTTITGIEDVERSIYFGYNTVLHELTHQVHGTFPPEDIKRIEDAFYAADAREESDIPTYMDRYQASSEFEYLAEGANAMFSPRRNQYDTREMVRERLYAMDTALVALIEYYLPAPNLEACYPVGLVNAADDAIENQNLDLAMVYADRAQARDAKGEVVLNLLSRLNSLLDKDSVAIGYAAELTELYPQKAASHDMLQAAEFFRGASPKRCIEILEAGLQKVDSTERLNLLQSLGDAYWFAGKYDQAAVQYEEILREQSNDDSALRGLAVALGDAGKYEESDTLFQKALKRRSGVVDLRLDYARMLLNAGRLDDAQIQIDEAALLSPEEGPVRAYQGWLSLAQGNDEEARKLLEQAIKLDPDYRLTSVLLAKTAAASDDPDAAKLHSEVAKLKSQDIPEWQYIKQLASYTPRKIWPDYLTVMADNL
jgi:tetratricopeptide (TPR) repeat protein